jgi:hypothetical protein
LRKNLSEGKSLRRKKNFFSYNRSQCSLNVTHDVSQNMNKFSKLTFYYYIFRKNLSVGISLRREKTVYDVTLMITIMFNEIFKVIAKKSIRRKKPSDEKKQFFI